MNVRLQKVDIIIMIEHCYEENEKKCSTSSRAKILFDCPSNLIVLSTDWII